MLQENSLRGRSPPLLFVAVGVYYFATHSHPVSGAGASFDPRARIQRGDTARGDAARPTDAKRALSLFAKEARPRPTPNGEANVVPNGTRWAPPPSHVPGRPGDPVRVVAVSDTHGHHGALHIPDGDVLLFAGDFAREGLGTAASVQELSDWLARMPHPQKFVVAGNHDQLAALRSSRLGSAVYLEDSGSEFTVNGRRVKIWGSPWQPQCQSTWNAFPAPRPAHSHAYPLVNEQRNERSKRVNLTDRGG